MEIESDNARVSKAEESKSECCGDIVISVVGGREIWHGTEPLPALWFLLLTGTIRAPFSDFGTDG